MESDFFIDDIFNLRVKVGLFINTKKYDVYRIFLASKLNFLSKYFLGF
jgi:hypothetical protein